MNRRVLESSYTTVTTSGIANLVGPSEDRVTLVVATPSSGFIGIAPEGKAGGGVIGLVSPAVPLVIEYRIWGNLVKAGWDMNAFGTSRTIAVVEVLERWVELPDTGTQVQPEQQQGKSEQQGTVDQVGPLSGRTRKKYRRGGILG